MSQAEYLLWSSRVVSICFGIWNMKVMSCHVILASNIHVDHCRFSSNLLTIFSDEWLLLHAWQHCCFGDLDFLLQLWKFYKIFRFLSSANLKNSASFNHRNQKRKHSQLEKNSNWPYCQALYTLKLDWWPFIC